MTLRNFDVPDELWEDFLKSIEGQYKTAAEALRDLMRRHIEKRKEASTDA